MRPGQQLGQYELICQTAEGGMASVWLGRSTGTRGFKKVVAVKTMLPSVIRDPDAERMFLAEAAVASRIDHPNVVQTLDLCEEEGALYLVMEWVRGESLGTVFSAASKKGGMPLATAIRIVSQVAAGLHAAHELTDASGKCLGLVHRDVSPHNVLVGFNGVVKVADFGIAKLTESPSFDALDAAELKGKVSYMAPEQIRLEPIDRRADTFATGILLYLLTTGRHPFKRDDQHETALAIVSGEPVVPPRSFLGSYPVRLERVVLRALAKEPDERYATARELGEELLRALPSSFKGAGHDEIGAYMRELLPEQFEKHQRLVKVARDAPDVAFASVPSGVRHVLKATGRSSATLRAVAVSSRDGDDRATLAPPVDESLDPRSSIRRDARGKRAVAASAGVLFVVLGAAALMRGGARPAGGPSSGAPSSDDTPVAPASGIAQVAPVAEGSGEPARPTAEAPSARPEIAAEGAPAASAAPSPKPGPVRAKPRPPKPRSDAPLLGDTDLKQAY